MGLTDHNSLKSRGVLQHYQLDNIAGRTYDVTLYGAKGDGKTDDRAAIQAAIDAASAAGGGIVHIPAGTWIVGAGGSQVIDGHSYPYSLRIKQGVRLKGVGFQGNTTTAGGSVLKLAAGANCNMVVTYNSAYSYGIGFEGMTFDGNKANNTASTYSGYGIVLTCCDRPLIHDCFITSCDLAGVYGIGSGGSYYAMQPRISNCYLWDNDGGGIVMDYGCTDALITQCDIGQNGYNSAGKGIIATNGAIITDTAVWGNGSGIMTYYRQNITIAGCRIDYNIGYGLYLFGSEGVVVSGCNIYRNSAAGGGGTYPGIWIGGDTTHHSRNIVITGCRIGQESGADYLQKYGVEIDTASAASGYVEASIQIGCCNLVGNSVAGYLDVHGKLVFDTTI